MSIVLSMMLVSCGSSDDGNTSDTSGESKEVQGLTEAFAEQPAMLTSIGQSADVEMIKALMDNAGLEYEMDKLITGDEIGDEKTLILAVGGSSKGLGAAGIDADSELDRTNKLIEAAKDKDIKIIAMHVGGENRRGELSDKFIGPSAGGADYIIVVDEGNKDGMFTDIASKNDIPMDVVTSIADAIEPLKKAFK
jgi:hypothetical protein